MPTMRFIHCADIHLDSPLRGLTRYEGAPVEEVRGATRRAFENLVQLALREQVDFVVCAGDLYDGDWQDFNTGLFFAKGMAQLGAAGIPVYLLRGNHDAASKLTRSLPLSSNVRLFDHKVPQTFTDEHLGVALHGQSFATAAVSEDLAAAYPAPIRGFFNLAVLHTALAGRPCHANYAPTSIDVLRAKGYDYWALGHVHKREVVITNPWIVFPGNLQGRHIYEQGAKGCELVSVVDGEVTSETVALDVLRWLELDLDATAPTDFDAVLDRFAVALRDALADASERILALRLRLRCGADTRWAKTGLDEQFRSVALDISGGRAWLEKIALERLPARARFSGGDDPLALLQQEIAALAQDDATVLDFAGKVLKEMRHKLPAEMRIDREFDLESPAVLRALLREVEDDLLARWTEA